MNIIHYRIPSILVSSIITNVQPCHIRCLIILGGDTRQILNNLREEDNLQREDKSAAPKVSSLRRFYCIAILYMELYEVVGQYKQQEFRYDGLMTTSSMTFHIIV